MNNQINSLSVLKQTELLGQQFTVYGTLHEPLFMAADVAEMIKHSDVSKMMRIVDDDEKLIRTIFLSGQNRTVWFLTENGLYEVLMQSRKPIAKQFKKGVKTILKEIRCTGGYNSKPLTPAEQLLQNAQILVEQEKRLNKVEERVLQIEAKTQTRPDYYTVAGYGKLHGITVNLTLAISIGRRATKICKERGLDTDTIPDPRFGLVKTYPSKVLDEAFRMTLTVEA